jgi:hypothetical protein
MNYSRGRQMGFFEYVLVESPTLTYSGAIDWAREDFIQDFEEHWGLLDAAPPEGVAVEDWQRLKELSSLAQKMALGASTLIRPRRLSSQRMALPAFLRVEASKQQELVDSILQTIEEAEGGEKYSEFWWQLYRLLSPRSADDPRVQQAIFDTYSEIEADKLFGTTPARIAHQMGKLLPYLLQEQSELTTAYLTRVAGCYVREMKPEFAVMARAVLDTAIQAKVDDDAVRSTVGGRRDGNVTLAARIQACLAVGVFDQPTFDFAERIREAGRIAAHVSPGLEGNIDALLEALVACLRALDDDG